MPAKCPYCRNIMELQRGASELRLRSLDEKTYVYFCNGKNIRKPHPPVIVQIQVTSSYDDSNIMSANIFIYQELPKADVLVGYRAYLRGRRHGVDVGDGSGPVEKDRHNPYTGRFKCTVCSRKPKRNDKLSTYDTLTPDDRVLAYDCKHITKDHRLPITFYVTKIFITEKNRKALPLPYDLYRVDFLDWQQWVAGAYTPQAIARRASYKESA